MALAAGFAVYVWLFNPQTLDSHWAFAYLTASIPSCLLAGVLHLGLTKAFARSRTWGDYPR